MEFCQTADDYRYCCKINLMKNSKFQIQLHKLLRPIEQQISVRHSIAMFILYSFLAAPLIKADIDIYGNGGIFDIFSFLFVVFFAS